MTGDDDIAASLPRPPIPAPARREAAIAEALRRFDGGAARPAETAGDRRPARPAPWSRPYAGALAGAFLVALVGLPFVWTAFDDYAGKDGGERRPAVEAPAPATADSVPAQPEPGPAGKSPPAAVDEPGARPPEKPAPAASPAPAEAAADRPARGETSPGEARAEESGEIVVTGSRIRNPDLASSVPITSVGGEDFALGDKRESRAAKRGDWNACTIEDPGQSLERCRAPVATVARGARGRAAAPLTDGLSSAWKGDLEGATAAFDRAIALSPRSSSAWLNRGLAWRRRGDLDRALADLDKAVLYAPNDARVYYQRSLVLRQRGDLRRARADEARAVQLDPRYAPLVRTR